MIHADGFGNSLSSIVCINNKSINAMDIAGLTAKGLLNNTCLLLAPYKMQQANQAGIKLKNIKLQTLIKVVMISI
ncbi:MAG: hypothetical protein GY928_12420 [Colwellia sp.]|nr:hypothetical protein [Colwellia sp.]